MADWGGTKNGDPGSPWNATRTAITLAVLNERLEAIEEKIDVVMVTQGRKSDDLEQRVRMVERWMYAVPASIITAITAIAMTIISSK